MSRFTRITRVGVTGSTNEDMARMLGVDDTRGLTLVADYQEHGSGRKGRAWIAPPGSALLCTVALPDPLPAGDLWIVPFWTGVVLHRALAVFGVEAALQWPNDVLVAGRKVAGILCISRVAGDSAWAGCGIGVNVHRPNDESALAQIEPPPAFLSDVAAGIGRDALLQAILEAADAVYGDLARPANVLLDWETRAGLPGARYRVLVDGEAAPFNATAQRVAPGGSLIVVDESGRQREIALADARVLR